MNRGVLTFVVDWILNDLISLDQIVEGGVADIQFLGGLADLPLTFKQHLLNMLLVHFTHESLASRGRKSIDREWL